MAGTVSTDQIISLSGGVIHWLFTWSWQAFLLLGVAWVGLKLDRSRSAATRYRIWLIAILAVAALPLLGTLSHILHLPIALAPLPTGDIGDAAALVGTPQAARPAISWPPIIWPMLSALWVAGVVIWLLRLGKSLRKLYLIQAGARAVSLAQLDCSYSDLPHADTGAVSVALSEGIRSPGLAGLVRPVILLPADILSWTSPEERTSILRHELAHVERWDHLASLFQSVLGAFLFFHPMLRYACNQLSLERELACDDRVLGLGTEPKAYAEAILKAAERSFLTDVVHQAASFTSRRTLERRIEMILNTNRMRRPLRQWPFLLLPVMLIGVSTWLVIPAASSRPVSRVGDSQPASNGPLSARSVSPTSRQNQLPPVVDKATVWIDSVKRGPLLRQVPGLGVLVPGNDGRLKAAVQVPAPQAKDIRVGQPASVDTRQGVIPGKVIHIGSDDSSGLITVNLSLEGDLPQSARAGLNVDGAIEIDRLDDVLYVGRPANGKADGIATLFRLDEGGTTATRIQVEFGKSSVNAVEIIEGLKVGDEVIISDMSAYAGVNAIRLN